MRIIGGQFKARQFHPPANIPTRPTTDMAKEALFNVINNSFNFDTIKVLDLFGGTGSISYEFASRGCLDITSVEIFPKCANFIRKTALDFGFGCINVQQQDVFQFVAQTKTTYDLIFAGPPYPLPNLASIPDVIFQLQLLEGAGWFILEHNPDHNFEQHPHFWKKKNYGSTTFAIFLNDVTAA